ncbi:glycosyltransferase family 2 protein [Guyparkeria hydrothermalis]|uniref:glycosyltransferase family 2 protein n=1 Tax=Guyparkeria hydrothermalis TaxID=923 RepID=UPI0020226CE3|nr:glycosyltransferase family 2 protein [Guyparkeria hydrothermalis]MCL7743686.1 glycosyltransferase family 2 protein [Guyparkeria hydrothermalis]
MIDVVIVNWNSGLQLMQCLRSVLGCGGNQVARVIVVDNNSADGSAAEVDGIPGVEVFFLEANVGFGAACNKGAQLCSAPYLLFLNPDTVVEPDSFSVALNFMNGSENESVGVCGIQLVDENAMVARTCARYPNLLRFFSSATGIEKIRAFRWSGVIMHDWDHQSTRQVDHVIGAFYLIRRNVFEDLKGFDERFFVYLEDLDLSYRVHDAGWDIWYLANARAFHAGGGTSRQIKAKRLFYSLRSRLLYGFKYFPRWQAWALVGVTVVFEPISRVVWCVARGDVAGIRQTGAAYRMLWRGMGRIVRGEGRFEP